MLMKLNNTIYSYNIATWKFTYLAVKTRQDLTPWLNILEIIAILEILVIHEILEILKMFEKLEILVLLEILETLVMLEILEIL